MLREAVGSDPRLKRFLEGGIRNPQQRGDERVIDLRLQENDLQKRKRTDGPSSSRDEKSGALQAEKCDFILRLGDSPWIKGQEGTLIITALEPNDSAH